MARYQVILAYDGTGFEGFQRQARSRTVQAEVESALRQFGWQGRAVLSAGRTDTGVHALGQVIAFDLEWNHSVEDLCQALNAHLPVDIAARQVEAVGPGFHPRYDAAARRYCYRIFCDAGRNPLLERYAWRVWPAVELQALQAAADLLPGRQDFAAFGAPQRRGGSTIRQLFSAEWQAQDGELVFTVSANAFLYHMVRRLVYIQVLAGQGRLGLETIRDAVEAGSTLPPGIAPPNGLTLVEVVYGSRQE